MKSNDDDPTYRKHLLAVDFDGKVGTVVFIQFRQKKIHPRLKKIKKSDLIK